MPNATAVWRDVDKDIAQHNAAVREWEEKAREADLVNRYLARRGWLRSISAWQTRGADGIVTVLPQAVDSDTAWECIAGIAKVEGRSETAVWGDVQAGAWRANEGRIDYSRIGMSPSGNIVPLRAHGPFGESHSMITDSPAREHSQREAALEQRRRQRAARGGWEYVPRAPVPYAPYPGWWATLKAHWRGELTAYELARVESIVNDMSDLIEEESHNDLHRGNQGPVRRLDGSRLVY